MIIIDQQRMKQLVLILLLVVLSTADHHESENIQLKIANATKVNVEDDDRIVAGNEEGEIEVYTDSKHNASRIISDVHRGKIIFIEQYEFNRQEEYAIVDETGLVTIWNNDLSVQRFSLDVNQTIYNVAIREQKRGVGDNRLALNLGEEILELSLSNLSHLRTYNQTGSYLALIYTDTKLIASTDNSTLVIFSENGTLLQEILISEGNVNLLSKHNHNGEGYSLSEDVVGISNGTYLIHYVNGSIDFNQLISKQAATSLNFCKGKVVRRGDRRQRRRENEDLIVVGYNHSRLQLRSLTNFYQALDFNEEIRDIECKQQEIFILSSSQVKVHELDHHEHSEGKLSAIAAVFFIILVLAIVAYQIGKRKGKQEVSQYKEVQLKEVIVNTQNRQI